eukprot:8533515-Pyramimonas_sp.AAC.1
MLRPPPSCQHLTQFRVATIASRPRATGPARAATQTNYNIAPSPMSMIPIRDWGCLHVLSCPQFIISPLIVHRRS